MERFAFLLPFVLAAGCVMSAPELRSAGSPPDARALLSGYADSGEGERELERLIRSEQGRTSIRASLIRLLAVAKKNRAELRNEWNALQVVGRAHSPSEDRWLSETAPREMNRLDARIRRLDGFRRRHFSR